MFRHTTVKKSLILLVAVLMLAAVVFAACDGGKFKPVTLPEKGAISSNGGIAVQYGEWLYYVNGYTSDTSAENTYVDVTDAPRIGSVVRIKIAEIAELFKINDNSDLTSAKKTANIAAAIRGETIDDVKFVGAQTVIPKIYYSGNTTSTQLTGIFIFGERIYVTTPNDELTPGGEKQTDQLVLTSFTLDGGDMQRHLTLTSNSAEIWLEEVSGKVVATYLMDKVLHTFDVASGTDTIVSMQNDPAPSVANTVSGVKWDVASKCVYFIDKFGSICKLSAGQTAYEVIVKNDDYEVHTTDEDAHIEAGDLSYTINSVNNGRVYYTKATGGDVDNVVLYWATSAGSTDNVALPTTNLTSIFGWGDGVIYVSSHTQNNRTLYGIFRYEEGMDKPEVLLSPAYNDSSITIEKIEGNTLYYNANSVYYKLDLTLGTLQKEGTPYAKSPTTTGWAYSDFVDVTVGDEVVHYVISMGTNTISVVKFDTKTKTNSSSISLLLKAASEEK